MKQVSNNKLDIECVKHILNDNLRVHPWNNTWTLFWTWDWHPMCDTYIAFIFWHLPVLQYPNKVPLHKLDIQYVKTHRKHKLTSNMWKRLRYNNLMFLIWNCFKAQFLHTICETSNMRTLYILYLKSVWKQTWHPTIVITTVLTSNTWKRHFERTLWHPTCESKFET